VRRGLIPELEKRAAREQRDLTKKRYLDVPGSPRRPPKMEGAVDPRYRTARWQKLRSQIIAGRQCQGDCGGVLPVRYADHIIPVREDTSDENFFNPANIQAICAPDHAKKTANERDKRLGRKPRVRYIRGCDVNGDPLDSTHPWYVGPDTQK
jgi:5-methylcytosine-specific restriction endonuclease McrA